MTLRRNDTQAVGFTPKAAPGTPEYKERVAEPTMKAVDSLPPEYRALVHEFGYIDVYRAFTRGWPVERIRSATRNGAFRI